MLLAGALPEDKLRAVGHAVNEQLSGGESPVGDTGVPAASVSPGTSIDLRGHVTQPGDE